MATLLLRLAAPMQSWGFASKFDRRLTEKEPTKSGVIGMLACAMGIRREDSLGELVNLTFGVRIDQPGDLGVDFQMAHEQTRSKNSASWVTHRYYLMDAIFLAGVEGNQTFLEEIEQALRYPAFPVCLGRRSCPPSGQLSLGIRDKNLRKALQEEPWLAAHKYCRYARKEPPAFLEIARDAALDENPTYSVRDVPITFSQKRRMYDFRNVVREQVPLSRIWSPPDTDLMGTNVETNHDPMGLLEAENVSIAD